MYKILIKKIKLIPLFYMALVLNACKDNESTIACQVDGNKAFKYVQQQCAFGNRYSGTEELKQTTEWIVKTAEKLGYQPKVDVWQEKTILGDTTFRNVKATLKGGKPGKIIVGTHYDLKYFKEFPKGFTGANDSASSTAVVLEMMRVLKPFAKELSTIEFYFFDGEECFESYSDTDGLFGSKRAANKIVKDGTVTDYKAMVLLDMIGDKDLEFTWSIDTNQRMVDYLKDAAKKLGVLNKVKMLNNLILDDHVPFQRIGIPAIDLIDFEYGEGNQHWHTGGDHIEHVSPESMAIAGNVANLMILAISQED